MSPRGILLARVAMSGRVRALYPIHINYWLWRKIMDMLTALLHLAGITLSSMVLGFLALFLLHWFIKRHESQVLNEYALCIGMPQDEFCTKQLNIEEQQHLLEWMLEKYSNDHFKNRFSDLLGLLLTVKFWLVNIIITILSIATIWTMVAEKTWEPVSWWWLYVGWIIFDIIVTLIYAWVCRVLTDRNPGDAKRKRRELADRYNLLLKDKREYEQSEATPHEDSSDGYLPIRA